MNYILRLKQQSNFFFWTSMSVGLGWLCPAELNKSIRPTWELKANTFIYFNVTVGEKTIDFTSQGYPYYCTGNLTTVRSTSFGLYVMTFCVKFVHNLQQFLLHLQLVVSFHFFPWKQKCHTTEMKWIFPLQTRLGKKKHKTKKKQKLLLRNPKETTQTHTYIPHTLW